MAWGKGLTRGGLLNTIIVPWLALINITLAPSFLGFLPPSFSLSLTLTLFDFNQNQLLSVAAGMPVRRGPDPGQAALMMAR